MITTKHKPASRYPEFKYQEKMKDCHKYEDLTLEEKRVIKKEEDRLFHEIVIIGTYHMCYDIPDSIKRLIYYIYIY